MDKLARYNQKILAVLGTLAVLGLLFLLGMMLYFFFDEMVDHSYRNAIANELMASDSSETEQKLRRQEITFLEPVLIDTPEALYVIPVSQVNLQNPEYVVSEDEYGVLGMSNSKFNKRYSRINFSGNYNNILTYRAGTGQANPVFSSKVNISKFENRIIANRHYLLLTGSYEDTNKDGKLSDDDLQAFYLYDFEKEELKQLKAERMQLISYKENAMEGQLILRFGLDKNGDGIYSHYEEPVYIKLYSIADDKLVDLVDDKLKDRLQNIID